MVIKKTATIIIAGIMSLSLLAGCGGKDESAPNPGTDPKQPQTQKENPVIDKKKPEPERKKSQVVTMGEEPVQALDITVAEIKQLLATNLDINAYRESANTEQEATYYINEKQEYPLDYKISFDDGSSITIPCEYADLEAAGWTTEANLDEREMSESSGGMLHSGVSLKVSNADSRIIEAGIFNFEKVKKMASECSVATIKVENYTYNYTREEVQPNSSVPSFTICGTINNKSTLKDVVGTLGLPKTIICKQKSIYYKSIPSITAKYEMIEGEVAGRLNFEFTADGTTILSVKYEKIG